MKTKAAVLFEQPGKWEIVELDLDAPRHGEVLVKMGGSGLCHSDVHVTLGEQPVAPPIAGGHEGAGTVVAVGPDTPGWAEGDKLVCSFIPACGRCRMCATGRQSLCDLGALIFTGSRPDDPTSFRMSLDGLPVAQMAGISTHAEYTVVDVRSAVKIPQEIPLDRAALVGCGVGTGWGSVENAANVQAGDVIIVTGIGGVGINSVQSAHILGMSATIAVDPLEFKRQKALEFGATHAASTIAEAAEIARSLTNGQGADAAVVTVGSTDGTHVAEAVDAIRKGGTVVVTGVGDISKSEMPVNPTLLTLFQKRIQGALYGSCNPTTDIPRLLGLYTNGQLKLDELITKRYSLEEVNQGYEDLLDGQNIRGVITFDQAKETA